MKKTRAKQQLNGISLARLKINKKIHNCTDNTIMTEELFNRIMQHNPFIIVERVIAQKKVTNFADSNYYGGYHE
jgi:hypothetical protein